MAIAGADDTAFARGYAAHMPEGVAAMIGACLLFVLPVNWRERRFTLTWDEAVKIDWGITLYGGGWRWVRCRLRPAWRKPSAKVSRAGCRRNPPWP